MKQMEVCEVCGAFLIVGDAPQRQDEHLMGKQHAGYAQVRAEIEQRKVCVARSHTIFDYLCIVLSLCVVSGRLLY